jgi:hypothetical protein
MIGDFRRKVISVYNGWRHKAARMAVLTPLLGLQWQKEGIPDAMEHVRRRWWARLMAYKGLRWQRIDERKKYLNLRNCHPFGMKVDGYTNYCNCGGMLCPFCFAREYVYKTYSFLEEVLYGDKELVDDYGKFKRAPHGLKLIEFKLRKDIYLDKSRAWCPQNIADELFDFQRRMRDNRRREIDMFACAAGVVIYTMEVSKKRKLVAHRNGLILTREDPPKEFPTSGSETSAFTFTVHPQEPRIVTRELIAHAISRVCKYPNGIFNADAEEVLAVVDGLQGFRQFSTYGKRFQSYLCEGDAGGREP